MTVRDVLRAASLFEVDFGTFWTFHFLLNNSLKIIILNESVNEKLKKTFLNQTNRNNF